LAGFVALPTLSDALISLALRMVASVKLCSSG
jgi:hypothetical protein